MKIIGTGKIDDFQKVILEKGVMKTLNTKPGDSVLFYTEDANGSVSMFKAKNARVTDECDGPMRRHMRGGPKTIRDILMFGGLFMIITMVLTTIYVKQLPIYAFIGILVFWILGMGAMIAAIIAAGKIDDEVESKSLVTIGGPYTKDRMTGVSKLLSDGYTISGTAYINALFGKNPESVSVRMEYDNGNTDVALTECEKNVSGYSVYRIRSTSEHLNSGKMIMTIVYPYQGKKIILNSNYSLEVKDGSSSIKVTEDDVSATIEFNESFNQSKYDEALFDPTDDEMVI